MVQVCLALRMEKNCKNARNFEPNGNNVMIKLS